MNCLAGIAPDGADPGALHQIFMENLKFAAEEFEKVGIVLLTEPINTRDIPGFYLNRSDQALAIIAEVGSANLKLQYDVYHMQIMEGDLTATLERIVGHCHIAPERKTDPGPQFDWMRLRRRLNA